jgi:hypothetical protein
VDQARAGLGRQRERVIDRMRRLCESKALLLYVASIFPIQKRKGNVKALEERMTAPFALDSRGVFVDLGVRGMAMGLCKLAHPQQRRPGRALVEIHIVQRVRSLGTKDVQSTMRVGTPVSRLRVPHTLG